jgi:hypothetical protein
MSKVTELVEGIKDARAAGLKDVEAKLQKKLDELLEGDAPTTNSRPAESSWIEGQGLEAAIVEVSELPKRSRQERRLADDYFNEGVRRYEEDEERFQEMASNFDEIPGRTDPEID